MKLVLHIGMPKSGTSALQASLRTSAAGLRRHGLLYPAGKGLPRNHNLLVCGVADPAKLPRVFRQMYGDDRERMAHDVEAFMQTIERQIAQARPDTLVLSGELLFRALEPDRMQALKAALARFSRDISVVVYVRSPAQFYVSQAQQVLKASSRISPPRPIEYRRIIEAYAGIAGEVAVIAYERAGLVGADITRDFLHRLGRADGLETETPQQANQTLSAEGMDILHRYRARNHPGGRGVFTKDTGLLFRTIAALDEGVEGFARPRLCAPVRDYINGVSVDLLWLRERHGIVFSDIDYARISDGIDPPDMPRRVAEICEVDRRRRERLLMAVLGHLAGQIAGEAPMHFKAAPRPAGRRRRARAG